MIFAKDSIEIIQPSRPTTQVETCGVTLHTIGGTFTPQTCQFEVIAPGKDCVQNLNRSCPEYKLTMRDDTPSHIREISLYYFKNFDNGSYSFDPSASTEDFKGTIIDGSAAARNLLKGTISFQAVSGIPRKIDFQADLSFDNNISMGVWGTLPVVDISKP